MTATTGKARHKKPTFLPMRNFRGCLVRSSVLTRSPTRHRIIIYHNILPDSDAIPTEYRLLQEAASKTQQQQQRQRFVVRVIMSSVEFAANFEIVRMLSLDG